MYIPMRYLFYEEVTKDDAIQLALLEWTVNCSRIVHKSEPSTLVRARCYL
jgi:hypothetical protein